MDLQKIETKIHEIRGQKVILDFDLAQMYEVETKRLKEAVRRNIIRFPIDFMFEITRDEYNFLRSQIATLEKTRGKYTKYLPFAFTEQGLAMLSGVLNSDKAIEVNIAIMRAFVFVRQYALTHKDLTDKLKEIETKYDQHFSDICYLMKKDQEETEQNKREKIGYKK
jgi:hypothetical protein